MESKEGSLKSLLSNGVPSNRERIQVFTLQRCAFERYTRMTDSCDSWARSSEIHPTSHRLFISGVSVGFP